MRIKYPFDYSVMVEQTKLAQINEQDAQREMRNFRRSIQDKYGYEIKLERAQAGVLPKTTTVWDQDPPVMCHTIRLGSPSQEMMSSARIMEPYVRGQALMKIEIECVAREAGVHKLYVMTRESANDIRGLCEPWVQEEISKGKSEKELRKVVGSAVFGLSYSVNSYPTKMLVDLELNRRFPILRPAQFVRENLWELYGSNDPSKVMLPDPLTVPLRALHAANRLFLDEDLFNGTTTHFAALRGTTVGNLAEELFKAAKTEYGSVSPGCHYALMNRFAEITGFPNMIKWEDRPRHEYLAETASFN